MSYGKRNPTSGEAVFGRFPDDFVGMRASVPGVARGSSVGLLRLSDELYHRSAKESMFAANQVNARPLLAAGAALGIGMGGFVDGILFHQILQLHTCFRMSSFETRW